MAVKIFYSWQADTSKTTGRNFIERALEQAIKKVSADVEIDEAVRDQIEIDKDTMGVPGSPPIVETIFRKIDAAAIFIPDLTFVGKRTDGRPTPNPNVMIEYGWALKALTHSRIVPVMNIAYGPPTAENMPFDLRHLRNPIQYNLSENADGSTKADQKVKLADAFEQAIRAVLNSSEFKQSQPQPIPPRLFESKYAASLSKFRGDNEPLGYSENLYAQGQGIPLSDGPVIWLRVMPTFKQNKTWKITELKEAATGENHFLMPLGGARWQSYDYIRASDGFGIYGMLSRAPESTSAVVFCFNTGEVWGIDSYIIKNLREQIPYYEAELTDALQRYSKYLERIGVERPHRWIAGYEGLQGRHLNFPARPGYFLPPGGVGKCFQDTIIGEGTLEAGNEPLDSIRPFFDKIFDQCGIERPAHLDMLVRERLSR